MDCSEVHSPAAKRGRDGCRVAMLICQGQNSDEIDFLERKFSTRKKPKPKDNTTLPDYGFQLVGHMGLALAQEVEVNSFL